MTDEPLQVGWEQGGPDAPVDLVVVRGADVVVRAPAPPWLRRHSADVEQLPGVDLDVVWLLQEAPPGVEVWIQSFRDGLEVDGAPPCRNRIELEVRYADMVRLCYLGMPFDQVLSPEEILPLVAPLSCLVGLLHRPGAARLGALSSEVAEAVIASTGTAP